MDKNQAIEFQQELKSLLAKYDAALGVDIEGDTHCLSTYFFVSDSRMSVRYCIVECATYIDSSDIEV
jgi:hypothetical protein